MGKISKMQLNGGGGGGGGIRWEYANDEKIYVYGKMSSGGCLPQPLGYIYMYMTIIFKHLL